MFLCETDTVLLGVLLSSPNGTKLLVVEPGLFELPEFFAGPETLRALGLVPPVALPLLGFLDGTLVGVVEGEGARGRKAHVKVLVADLVYAGVGVVGDVYALEPEEEGLCEADVVVGIRDLNLVLEGEWGGDGLGSGDLGGGGEPALKGGLSGEGDGGDEAGSAATVHVGVGMESCGEHLGGGRETASVK